MSIESSYQTFMDIDFWSSDKLRFKSGQLIKYKENEVSQWKKFKYKSKGSIQLEKIVSYINDHMDLFHGLAVERLEEGKFKEQCAHLRKRVLKSKTKIVDPKWFCEVFTFILRFPTRIFCDQHIIKDTTVTDFTRTICTDCLTTTGDISRYAWNMITDIYRVTFMSDSLSTTCRVIPWLFFTNCSINLKDLNCYGRERLPFFLEKHSSIPEIIIEFSDATLTKELKDLIEIFS